MGGDHQNSGKMMLKILYEPCIQGEKRGARLHQVTKVLHQLSLTTLLSKRPH